MSALTRRRTLQQADGRGRVGGLHRYNETMFKLFEEAFNSIPLAACIGGKALVVHGGLFSRDDVTLDDLRAINRYKQPGNEGSWLAVHPALAILVLTRGVRYARSCEAYQVSWWRCCGPTRSPTRAARRASAASAFTLAQT